MRPLTASAPQTFRPLKVEEKALKVSLTTLSALYCLLPACCLLLAAPLEAA